MTVTPNQTTEHGVKPTPAQLRALARAVAGADLIQFHSGDREPGANLPKTGQAWIAEALNRWADICGTND